MSKIRVSYLLIGDRGFKEWNKLSLLAAVDVYWFVIGYQLGGLG